MTNYIKSGDPEVSGLYRIDRGAQGIAYRYFDAKTKKWARPSYDPFEANELKGTEPLLGFFPWIGPLNLKPKREVVPEPVPKKRGRPKKSEVIKMENEIMSSEVAPVKPVKSVKPTKTKTKDIADGTIMFRADRNKWVAVWGGKQEAARDTPEACVKFLTKKYGVAGTVITKE
jgi:hypothetical protein